MAVRIPAIDRRPHLFLSHSSRDKSFIRRLTDDLNVCEIDVWFDEREIAPGDSITDAITDGLEKSKYIGVMLSKTFLASPWANEE